MLLHACQANVISLEPKFVQNCFLTLIKNLQWLTSLTKYTIAVASHVRLWLSVQKLFSHFYFQTHEPYPLGTLICVPFSKYAFYFAIFDLLSVSSLLLGMDSLPPFSLPANIIPWPHLECYHASWSVCWCLRMWEQYHLEKFWVFIFLYCKLATRVHILVCQQDSSVWALIFKTTHFHLRKGLSRSKI